LTRDCDRDAPRRGNTGAFDVGRQSFRHFALPFRIGFHILRGVCHCAHCLPMAFSRRPVLKLGVVDLGVETVSLPNGVTVDLAIIRHPGASAILAMHEDSSIAMLRQYRHAVGGYLWEVPAGCRNGGETALECAGRELREETGLVASQWDRLGSIVTVPSFCDERIDLFLARGLERAERSLDADEVIRVERVTMGSALEMVRGGQIVDAKTIAALYQALAFLEAERGSRTAAG
jgi:ADP-ribose diphosphatase